MLPCQGNCPRYVEGCHKECLRWKEFQQKQAVLRSAKKQYLRYYAEQSSAVLRQYRALGACYPVRS